MIKGKVITSLPTLSQRPHQEITMATSNFDAELDQLKTDVADLRKDIVILIEAMKDAGVNRGKEYYDQAYQRAKEKGESVRHRASETYGAFGKGVEERPLTSVLAAFGTGFVVGMILDHRHH
jgi:ElaB/YqjD/DUF883 family membrane-anchored ribosome-binding protein